MDTGKFNELLNELTSTDEADATQSELDLPVEFPDAETLISEGYDPQFAVYSALQGQMLLMATLLEESGSVDEYARAIAAALGHPQQSRVTAANT